MFHIIPHDLKIVILISLFSIIALMIAIYLKHSKFYVNAFIAVLILIAIIAFIC